MINSLHVNILRYRMLVGLASLGGCSEWPQNVRIKRALLVVLIGIVTIVEINFVGDTTIYSLEVANIREELHDSIVHNHPPAGGWVERGANAAMNIRVVIPYLVEFLHNETGACVPRLYKAVDIICIWLAFITVFVCLRQQFTARESALASLYYAAILPAPGASENSPRLPSSLC